MLETTLRLFAFWLKFLVVIALIVLAGVFAFLVAADYANIWAVASDGLEARASVVLMQGSRQQAQSDDAREELEKFFTVDFLVNDPLLKDSLYAQYRVTGFEYQINVEDCFVWPWQDEKVVRLTERVPVIDGQILEAYKTEEQKGKGEKVSPPEWNAGRYDITFKRIDGRWYMDTMTLVQKVPNIEAKTTPSPIEDALATSSASPVPSPSP